VLKKDSNGKFVKTEVGFIFKKPLYFFKSGKRQTKYRIEYNSYKTLLKEQQHTPTLVMSDNEMK
jgi:hypothetical protein